MIINNLSHVALHCSDYGRSLHFYRDVLGLKEKFSLYGYDGEIQLTYMEIVPGEFIELFPCYDGEIKAYDPATSAIRHVCLLVEDIEEAARELQQKGVTVYCGPKELNNPWPVPFEKHLMKAGEYCFYVADPDDNPVEFMQYVEPTTLMTKSDEELEALKEQLKNDTYVTLDPDHPMLAFAKHE